MLRRRLLRRQYCNSDQGRPVIPKHEFRGENKKIGKFFVNTKYPHAYMVYEKTKKIPKNSHAGLSISNRGKIHKAAISRLTYI